MTRAVTGIILAGGESRRMGQDKAHLPWGDRTLIEHMIDTLRPITDEIIVAVKDARAFRHLKATVVEDCVPDAHALGGLYTGLRAASQELCFVCACDTPFVNPELVSTLTGFIAGYDLAIPRSVRGLEPLHAVYARSALPAIEGQLRRQTWDLLALVSTLRARVVEGEALRRLDPAGLCFVNLNTETDYAMAEAVRITLGRHHARRGVGQRLLGPLLGMGSESNLGADHASPSPRVYDVRHSQADNTCCRLYCRRCTWLSLRSKTRSGS